MIKIRYLGMLLIFIACSSLSAVPVEDAIATARKGYQSFCKAGMSIIVPTIRSNSGALCKTPMGASVAMMACQGLLDFDKSTCAKHAQSQGIKDASLASQTLAMLLKSKQVQAQEVCGLINKILPARISCDEVKAAEVSPALTPGAVSREQLLQAKRTIKALDDYIKSFNQTMDVKFSGVMGQAIDKKIIVEMAFLPHSEEAFLEGKDFFEYSYEANQPKLAKIAAQTGIDKFNDKEGFVVASIGSSSMQGYYVQDGKVQNIQYLFGTTPSNERENLMDKMVADLKIIGRPVLFVNSIAFAKPADGSELEIIPLDKTVVFKTKDPEKDSAGIVATAIANKLNKELPAFISVLPKKDKLINKWTNSLAQAQKEFTTENLGYVVDYGGGGFSIKRVIMKIFYDTPDVAIEIQGAEVKMKQIPILSYYENISDTSGINPELVKNRDLIFSTIKEDIMRRHMTKPTDKPQDSYFILVRQTGQLRELYFKNIAMIEAAGISRMAIIIPTMTSDGIMSMLFLPKHMPMQPSA